jgi:hypothetical protein
MAVVANFDPGTPSIARVYVGTGLPAGQVIVGVARVG